jgi:hypothetical protein
MRSLRNGDIAWRRRWSLAIMCYRVWQSCTGQAMTPRPGRGITVAFTCLFFPPAVRIGFSRLSDSCSIRLNATAHPRSPRAPS